MARQRAATPEPVGEVAGDQSGNGGDEVGRHRPVRVEYGLSGPCRLELEQAPLPDVLYPRGVAVHRRDIVTEPSP